MSDIDTIIANVIGHDKGATPGPWITGKGTHWGREVRTNSHGSPAWCGDSDDARALADASLIAYYRTAAPLLAAEVERLRGILDRLGYKEPDPNGMCNVDGWFDG